MVPKYRSSPNARQVIGLIFIVLGILMLIKGCVMSASEELTARGTHELMIVYFVSLTQTILCVGSILLGAIMARKGGDDGK